MVQSLLRSLLLVIEAIPQGLKVGLVDLLAAKWARIVCFEPFLDARRVEVMATGARQRSHFFVLLELAEANSALFLRFEVVRVELSQDHGVHNTVALSLRIIHILIVVFDGLDDAWRTAHRKAGADSDSNCLKDCHDKQAEP